MVKAFRANSVILLAAIGAGLSHPALGARNPATVYCLALGYEHRVEQKDQGEVGYCVLPDGTVVEEWQFLQGKAGIQYGYCAIKGYGSKVVADPKRCVKFLTDSCLFCVLTGGKEVEVTELMGLTFAETTCGDGRCRFPENFKKCPADCPSGSRDGYCDGVKDGKCDPDCTVKKDPDCH